MKTKKHNRYLFRGTSLGWEGNLANRQLPRTSVTSHPVKAVLFALCCLGNNSVVYINTIDRIAGIPEDKNVLAAIEDEIAFEIPPNQYAAICEGYIKVDDAIKILKELGQEIPQLLDRSLFDMALKDVGKMNAKTVGIFYELAKQYLNKA